MITVGSIVRYSTPGDDDTVLFTVLEMRGDRLLMRANVAMAIRPTYVAMVRDVVLA